jgi:hypothetical protein
MRKPNRGHPNEKPHFYANDRGGAAGALRALGGRLLPGARRSARSARSGGGRRPAQQHVGGPSAASPHAAARPRGSSRDLG